MQLFQFRSWTNRWTISNITKYLQFNYIHTFILLYWTAFHHQVETYKRKWWHPHFSKLKKYNNKCLNPKLVHHPHRVAPLIWLKKLVKAEEIMERKHLREREREKEIYVRKVFYQPSTTFTENKEIRSSWDITIYWKFSMVWRVLQGEL